MIEEEIKDDMTCFVDIDANAFRVEVLFLKRDKHKSQIDVEFVTTLDKGDLWTLFFDCSCYKEGSGVGILLISPVGITYKFSFTLSFP